MRNKNSRWILGAATAYFLTLPAAAETAPPPWAYPVLAPGVKPPPDDGREKTLPGSKVSFTRKQMSDLFNAYDWFPDDHPTMPEVVAHGHQPEADHAGLGRLFALAMWPRPHPPAAHGRGASSSPATHGAWLPECVRATARPEAFGLQRCDAGRAAEIGEPRGPGTVSCRPRHQGSNGYWIPLSP